VAAAVRVTKVVRLDRRQTAVAQHVAAQIALRHKERRTPEVAVAVQTTMTRLAALEQVRMAAPVL
jgi:phosphoheptose isomerase